MRRAPNTCSSSCKVSGEAELNWRAAREHRRAARSLLHVRTAILSGVYPMATTQQTSSQSQDHAAQSRRNPRSKPHDLPRAPAGRSKTQPVCQRCDRHRRGDRDRRRRRRRLCSSASRTSRLAKIADDLGEQVKDGIGDASARSAGTTPSAQFKDKATDVHGSTTSSIDSSTSAATIAERSAARSSDTGRKPEHPVDDTIETRIQDRRDQLLIRQSTNEKGRPRRGRPFLLSASADDRPHQPHCLPLVLLVEPGLQRREIFEHRLARNLARCR